MLYNSTFYQAPGQIYMYVDHAAIIMYFRAGKKCKYSKRSTPNKLCGVSNKESLFKLMITNINDADVYYSTRQLHPVHSFQISGAARVRQYAHTFPLPTRRQMLAPAICLPTYLLTQSYLSIHLTCPVSAALCSRLMRANYASVRVKRAKALKVDHTPTHSTDRVSINVERESFDREWKLDQRGNAQVTLVEGGSPSDKSKFQ